MPRLLPNAFFRRPAARVARDLLGTLLVRELGGERLVLRLVETEAYLGPEDRACHAWGGRRTPRIESLYLEGGHAYVYFVYGMHFCLNVVTGPESRGEAVLLRAGEPLEGEVTMRRLRKLDRPPRASGRVTPGAVAGGPARLCQALAVDRALDGIAVTTTLGGLWLEQGEPVRRSDIAVGPRIGVGYAGEDAALPLRFALRGNPHVSRPRI
jgi:DNA-3-methyladenine glycosylase